MRESHLPVLDIHPHELFYSAQPALLITAPSLPPQPHTPLPPNRGGGGVGGEGGGEGCPLSLLRAPLHTKHSKMVESPVVA